MYWRDYFAGHTVQLSHEMLAAIVCERFGWTWDEYQDQPAWFNRIIWSMLQQEAIAQRNANKKAGV